LDEQFLLNCSKMLDRDIGCDHNCSLVVQGSSLKILACRQIGPLRFFAKRGHHHKIDRDH
jgi:hypothetical protein